MATQDGFNPYPIGLTAEQAVKGIQNGYLIDEKLGHYDFIAVTDTQPTLETVKTSSEHWQAPDGRLYRACYNQEDNILVWFEE